MQFRLEINLGNNAMCTSHDVATALIRIADELSVYDLDGSLTPWFMASIRDTEGNTVGIWEVKQTY